jgi:hypothetical protein
MAQNPAGDCPRITPYLFEDVDGALDVLARACGFAPHVGEVAPVDRHPRPHRRRGDLAEAREFGDAAGSL